MGSLIPEIERREQLRLRCRLDCALLVDGRRREGFVRELSADALHVQTTPPLGPGEGAVVVFRTCDGERFVLEAEDPEPRKVARSLFHAGGDGTVLRIVDPPPAWLRWVGRAVPRTVRGRDT